MVRSKVWATQDALAEMIAQATGFEGIAVQVGTPADMAAENVWVSSEISDWDMSYAVSGIRAKDESFVLRANIVVSRLGSEFIPARDRVKELGEMIEDLIAGDRTLAGNVEMATIERAALEDTMLDERRRGVGLVLFVRCRAWLNS